MVWRTFRPIFISRLTSGSSPDHEDRLKVNAFHNGGQMNIITWNANRIDRYQQLWADPRVMAWNWDVICLQETGAPDAAWTHAGGPVWNANAAARDTDESSVRRRYTYTPPGLNLVHIVHAEWPNRQKNHVVIITKAAANNRLDMSGQMGERPALGIKVRLTLPDGTARFVLIGTVHIVASYKSAAEVQAMLRFFHDACQLAQAQDWIIAGDFNCTPLMMAQALPGFTIRATAHATQDGGDTLDYILASGNTPFTCTSESWTFGTARSDHRLVSYQQVLGSAVQIL
jgi:endonuclease/exonuclease/phosphatase family metal-dependent hydrolase